MTLIVAWERCRRGEVCQVCHSREITPPAGTPATCWECECLQRSKREEAHGSLIRCPDCGHVQPIEDHLQEGENQVECNACEAAYTVDVRVELSYVSPARTARES